MRLLLATTNPGKLREIRELLRDAPVTVISLADLPPIEEPEETGETFEANALLKAHYYAAASGMDAVADDSGLIVDGLDGEPGVRSARFVRPDATYPERFAEIHRRLAARPETPRTARFVCAVAVVRAGAVAFETTGVVEGTIVEPARGTGGFGYDPIFEYPEYGKTFGEVDEAAKLRVAHRGVAFRALADWLRTIAARS